MKTTLSVQQILDLGGSELLKKVINSVGFKEDFYPPEKLLTFDSEFKKEKFDVEKYKVFVITDGKYEDKKYILIIAEDVNEAMAKANLLELDSTLSEDMFYEIDFDKHLFENNGVIYL